MAPSRLGTSERERSGRRGEPAARQACWRPAVASLLVNLLCKMSGSDQQAVVLRALSETAADTELTAVAACAPSRLEGYYNRIGFTSSTDAFEAAGLATSYCSAAGRRSGCRYLLYDLDCH